MSAAVSLLAVIEEIQAQSDETVGYLNRVTGECFTMTQEEMDDAENAGDDEDISSWPEWRQEALELARQILETNDYVRLPSQHDVHEWRIMQEFCYTVTNERQRD